MCILPRNMSKMLGEWASILKLIFITSSDLKENSVNSTAVWNGIVLKNLPKITDLSAYSIISTSPSIVL